MTRSKPIKGINERKSETTEDNYLEGTSARTRPFSFDDIMLARKTKMDTTKQGFIGPVVTDIALTQDGQTFSTEGYKHTNEDSGSKDNRHNIEDSRKSNSLGKGGTNASRESKRLVLNKGNESREHYPKLKSVVDKDTSNDRVREVRDKRHHHSHKEKRTKEKDGFLSDHSDNESDRKQSRGSFKKEKRSETSQGKFETDRKQIHNEGGQVSRKRKTDGSTTSDSECRKRTERDLMLADKSTDRGRDKAEKEVRHKRHHEDDRSRGRSSGDKHSTKKKGLDLTRAYHGEARSKRRRSQSREHVKEKVERSLSQSPKAHKQKTRDKMEHGEIILNTTKDRSEKENSDVDKRISSNGSNNQFRRSNNTSSSGLGGYSPRKRKTDAAAKTPSPTHRSPARRAAGWDLQPAEKESASADAHTIQNVSMNIQESPSVTPVAHTVIKPLGIFPHTLSSQMHAIESIQLTQATRPMRRLYVENLPLSASEKDLIECVNKFLLSSGVNYIQGTQPCISCIIHKEKGQALLEFLTPEDASAALSFDGISFSGSYLKLRRPKDYSTISTGVSEKSVVAVDSVCNNVEDSPHKIFIGGISRSISSKMLLEIARVFGPVKAFHYKFITDIKEPCAFLEYADHSVTSKACAGLNGMKLGGKVVTVVFATPDAAVEDVRKPPFYGIPEHAKPLLQNPLTVIKLKNALDPEGFPSLSESELEEILEDIRIECSRFGAVKSINIAKPTNSPGTIEAETQTDKHEPENWRSDNEKMGESTKEALALDQSELPSTVPTMASNCQIAQNNQSCDSITGVSNQSADQEDSNLPKVVGDSLPDEMNVDSLVKDEKCTSPSDDASKFVTNPSVEEPTKNDGAGTVDEAGGSIPPIIKREEKLKSEENTVEDGNPAILDTNEGNAVDSTKVENENEIGDIFEVGCIFVEYRRAEAACTAAHCLHGRLFDGRVVTVEYVRPDLYQTRFRK